MIFAFAAALMFGAALQEAGAQPVPIASPAREQAAPLPSPGPGPPVRVRERRHKKVPVAGVINVNRASEAELQLLPGIGRGRAQAIVERRERRPFASLDDLARMKGMRGVVRKLRAQLVVQGDTTVHPVRP